MILITIQLTPLSNEFTAEGNNRTIDQSSKHEVRLQTLRLRKNGANRSNPHPVLDIFASPDSESGKRGK